VSQKRHYRCFYRSKIKRKQQRNIQDRFTPKHKSTIRSPLVKREIPQSKRCQRFGHKKNFCRYNPRCVKCAAEHLTEECQRKTKDSNVKCVNCSDQHPANYRGCLVHKQLQQNFYPTLRERKIQIRPLQTGITYFQAAQQLPNIAVTQESRTISSGMVQPSNDLVELRQMMKALMDQMGTLINLMSTLVNKTK
jgi:hypothetical protein